MGCIHFVTKYPTLIYAKQQGYVSFSYNTTTVHTYNRNMTRHFINSPSTYQKCHVSNDMKRMKNDDYDDGDDDDSSSDESVGSDYLTVFATFYYNNTLIF
jgi:hypothetical protein